MLRIACNIKPLLVVRFVSAGPQLHHLVLNRWVSFHPTPEINRTLGQNLVFAESIISQDDTLYALCF